jgi:hypothetical protein
MRPFRPSFLLLMIVGQAWLAPMALADEMDTLRVDKFEAGTPDADLVVPLSASFLSSRLAHEPLTWMLEAERTPPNGTQPIRWVVANGSGVADPSGSPWQANFTASQGAGAYRVTLRASGPRLAEANATLDLSVPEQTSGQSEVNVTLDVEDAPTQLRLSSDAVNADGKAKLPGSALITRVVLQDANGLGDVRHVTFGYARNESGTLIPVEEHVLQAFPNGTEALLEDRFATAPMLAGNYVCTVLATGSGTASVARTFVIQDANADATLQFQDSKVPATGVSAARAVLALHDGNFGTGSLDRSDVRAMGFFRITLYRGSTRVTDADWVLGIPGLGESASPWALDLRGEGTRTTRFAYSVADGKGQLSLPLEVRVPASAAVGSYRASVALLPSNTTVASATFDVTSPPVVTELSITGSGNRGAPAVVHAVVAPSDGVRGLVVTTPWSVQVVSLADAVRGNDSLAWSVDVPIPRNATEVLEILAFPDFGEGVATDEALRQATGRAATLRVVEGRAPHRQPGWRLDGVALGQEAWVHPRAKALLEVEAAEGDLDANGTGMNVEIRDWNGTLVDWGQPNRLGAYGKLVLNASAAPRGKYTVTLRAQGQDGTAREHELAVHVGARFRLDVGNGTGIGFDPLSNGTRIASVPLRNAGNVVAGSLTVLAEGLPKGFEGNATLLLPNGTTLQAPFAGSLARFPRVGLGPGDEATLSMVLRVPDGAAAGTFRGRIVVAGEAA